MKNMAMAIGLARNAARKKMFSGGMTEKGNMGISRHPSDEQETCHACGGMINAKGMADGGMMSERESEGIGNERSHNEKENYEDKDSNGNPFRASEEDEEGDNDEFDVLAGHYAEGGGVGDTYGPSDTELVDSHEVSGKDFKDDNEEEGDNEAEKRNSFLRSYLIHRKLRTG